MQFITVNFAFDGLESMIKKLKEREKRKTKRENEKT